MEKRGEDKERGEGNTISFLFLPLLPPPTSRSATVQACVRLHFKAMGRCVFSQKSTHNWLDFKLCLPFSPLSQNIIGVVRFSKASNSG